jgi:hypothetical protein
MAMETHETMQKRIRITLKQLNEKQSRIYLLHQFASDAGLKLHISHYQLN